MGEYVDKATQKNADEMADFMGQILQPSRALTSLNDEDKNTAMTTTGEKELTDEKLLSTVQHS